MREVISTNQHLYQALRKDVREIISGEKEKMQHRRFFLPLAFSDFRELFLSFGTYCLIRSYETVYPRSVYSGLRSKLQQRPERKRH